MNTEEQIESLDDLNSTPSNVPETVGTPMGVVEQLNETLNDTPPVSNPDVSGISLGFSDQINPVTPTPVAASPLESSSKPIDLMTPSPGMDEPTMNFNDAVGPTNLDSVNINNFGQEGIPINNINQNPKPSSLQSVAKSDEYNNIGMVPPNAHIEQKPKKQLNLKFVLLIAIVLIIAIGVGIFLYLRLGNKSLGLKLKDVKVQVSGNISTNLNDYVASGNLDDSCVANFDEVKVSQIGTYNYKIICNSGTYLGNIIVVDETAPIVTTRLVYKTVGSEIKVADFIEDCQDVSNCTYDFADADAVKNYTNTAGIYEVLITVNDDQKNTKDIVSNLIVTEDEIKLSMICESKSIETQDGYSYIIKDTIGISNGSGGYIYSGFTMRSFIITYSDEKTYKDVKATIKDGSITHPLGTGKVIENDTNKVINITKFLSDEEKSSEFNEALNEYSSVRNAYQNDEREFECKTSSVE